MNKAAAVTEKERKRRVCCFCETWESGGIESFLTGVLTHMDLSGLEVDIVAARLGESVFTERLEKIGVKFYELSGSTRSLLKNWREFKRLVLERKYDVVHLNVFQGLALRYARIAERCGVKVRIAHSHNSNLRPSTTRWLKLFLSRLGSVLYAGAATHLWACSGQAARFLFSRRIFNQMGYTFIPNGINIERFRFVPEIRERVRKRMNLKNRLVFGSVGRLSAQKNQTFLLDVCAEMVKACPDVCLLLVGEGEEYTALRAKAVRLGIDNTVLFYGASDKVEELYCAMDVFMFPSPFEGLGIAAVEAQASGLPTLCSDQIPAEVHLTALTHTLSLEAEPTAWAEKALSLFAPKYQRVFAADEVKAAGFDAAETVRRVRAVYVGV